MNVPIGLAVAIQLVLLLASLYMFWSSWQIRSKGRYELMKRVGKTPLEAPRLIAREYALYYSVFGFTLLCVVVVWSTGELSFVGATIATTVISVAATAWRGSLIRLHDRRLESQPPAA